MLGVSSNGHSLAVLRIPRFLGNGFEMWFKAIADNFKSLNPIEHLSVVCGVNPLLPKTRRIAPTVEFGCPLQEPQDVDALAVIVDCTSHDGFYGKRTDLHFDSDRDTVYVCAYIWADGSKRTLQSNIAHMGLLQKSLIDFHFASAMFIRFALAEFAGNGVLVGKVVNAVAAAFQENRITTHEAKERAVGL